MKLNIIIFLFFNFLCFGQEISFDLYLIDPCTNEISKADIYSLEKDGIEYLGYFDNELILPEKGEYQLIYNNEKLNILLNNIVNSDTLIAPKILELSTNAKRLYSFMMCNQYCNGIQSDYYNNGSLRIKAEFKNGFVIGDLIEYYPNGKIKKFASFNKRKYKTIQFEFNENGKLILFSTYGKKGQLIKRLEFD